MIQQPRASLCMSPVNPTPRCHTISRVHNRKSIRLKGYDYRRAGAYFVTICTYRSAHLLGEIRKGKVYKSEAGEIAEAFWRGIPDHNLNAQIDAYVIMPNHLHGIIWLAEDQEVSIVPSQGKASRIERGRDAGIAGDTMYRIRNRDDSKAKKEKFGHPVSGSLSTIMRSYKASVTRECRRRGLSFKWHSRFYDRIIRTEQQLKHVRVYIAKNPMNWKK